MGTRSRLIIYRSHSHSHSGKKPFYLWMRYDGYFEAVGDWLCAQIKLLLEKYSIPEINAMLDALEVAETNEDDSHNFNTDDLIPFIEGKTACSNDMCDDIEFEYRLDFNLGSFVGMGHGETRILQLDQIRAGKLISNYDEDTRADTADVSDKANVVFETIAAALKTLTNAEKASVLERLSKLV